MDESFRKAADGFYRKYLEQYADSPSFVAATNWAYTHLQSQHQAEVAQLVEALEEIANPIDCPACSMENPPENVPCYCYDFKPSCLVASEALSAFRKQRDGGLR